MKKGFTLIEVLIVVAIIGILASIILLGLGAFRGKGRDSRRMTDLRQVQNALELYFVKNGYYPNVSSWSELTTNLVNAGIGIITVSNDPTTGWNYGYCRAASESYVLAAYLEDVNNPALTQYPSGTIFPCDPVLIGTPSNPACSKGGSVTNKYCLTF